MIRWQNMEVPLVGGLDVGSDPRAVESPRLLQADNVVFDDGGGLQPRKPYSALPVPPGGKAIRRLSTYRDELLCWTEDTLWSWSPAANAWQSRGPHVSPTVCETVRGSTPEEQPFADRAQIGNTVVMVWGDASAHKILAFDAVSGAALYGPEGHGGDGIARPRVVALASKFLILTEGTPGGELFGLLAAADNVAADLAAGLSFSISGANTGLQYDVAVVNNVAYVAYQHTVTTSYGIASVTEAQVVNGQLEARTCDGPIAIAGRGTDTLCVLRAEGTNIDGDLFSGLTAGTVGTVVGTFASPLNQLTGAFKSVADGGEFRCHAFWSAAESVTNGDFDLKTNYIDTAASVGTQSVFVKRLGVASHAFDRDGSVYVWTAFAGESGTAGMDEPIGFRAALQNSYFLYDADGDLIAKAVSQSAGGFGQLTGHLPGVQGIGGDRYGWAGVRRMIIPLADATESGQKQTGYAARSPVDIVLSFDTFEGRRTAEIGRTLYVAGGQILQYDGLSLVELGWHIFPWFFSDAFVGGGALELGQRVYKMTVAWDNAAGELDRSTTATHGSNTPTSDNSEIQLSGMIPISVTRKTGTQVDAAFEIWRTEKNPPIGAPFYLATDKDPANDTGDNRYILNTPTAATISTFDDNMTDAVLRTKEANAENGSVLEVVAPPAASIIYADDERVYLAGVAGDPNRIWYSKTRQLDTVVGFNDFLSIELPSDGGPITALAELNGTLVAFERSAVYILPGIGFDNASGGSNFGPPQRVSADVGAVSQEATVITPVGVIFKSSKGWHLLDRGFTVQYIGQTVEGFDAETIVAMHVLEERHEVRALSAERLLVFNSKVGQWSSWTVTGGVSAVVWRGKYHYASSDGVFAERDDFASGVDYGLDATLAWIKPGGLNAHAAVKRFEVLGEYRSEHELRVRVAYDYDDTVVDDKAHRPVGTVPGAPLRVRHGFQKHKVSAVKIRLTAQAVGFAAPPTGEALRLTGIGLRVGTHGGLRRLPAVQSQ